VKRIDNEKPQNLHSSPKITRMTKPRRMKWAGHVALVGEMRNTYEVVV
jgi:hypothetical protein